MEKNLDLEQIYSLYLKDLYRYIYSLCKNKTLTEDIVQETFYRAYSYVESDKVEKIKPWLFKVAYHTFIDMMRKEKRVTYYSDLESLNSNGDSHVKSAEQQYFVKDSVEQWFKALERLSVVKRNVLLLRDYHQFSYQEIADMLDLPLSKVKVNIYRGRKELEKMRAEGEMDFGL